MQPCELTTQDLTNYHAQGVDELTTSVHLFTGCNADFQKFVEQTWSEAYSGKMVFPVWSSDYFDWQFGGEQNPNRRLAAYVGAQLVGVLAGRAAEFGLIDEHVKERQLAGAHYSWLTVSPAYRGQRIAPLLDEARIAHEQALNSDLVVSYRFHGSKHSLAEKPVHDQKAQDSIPTQSASPHSSKQFNRGIGFWARPLRPSALRTWNHNRLEGWMAQLAAPVLPKVRSNPSTDIRGFRDDDLPACHKLANDHQHKFAIRNHWSELRLHWQLNGHQITQTVVAEEQGEVQGFVNFHLLPFEGRTRKLIGIIDLCCCHHLSSKRQRQLVTEALARMKKQGAILALKSRTADVSTMLMLRTGFSPRPADSALVFQWIGHPQPISSSGPIQLLWR